MQDSEALKKKEAGIYCLDADYRPVLMRTDMNGEKTKPAFENVGSAMEQMYKSFRFRGVFEHPPEAWIQRQSGRTFSEMAAASW